MSALIQLYVERDRLRERRRLLEADLEALITPARLNARAINDALRRLPKHRGSDPAAFAPQQTTAEDLPEFFERAAE